MRILLVLVRKDFTTFFRNKAAVSLTFAVPFALIWLFGMVFGVNRRDTGPSGIPLAVVNASSSGDRDVDSMRSRVMVASSRNASCASTTARTSGTVSA